MLPKFHGTGVAIVTPFNADLSIDFDGLQRLVNHVIEGGVNYIVALGTTGENVTLSKEEKVAVVNNVVTFANKRVPVVVGHGGNNTYELLKGFDDWKYQGVDAILSVSPYYNKPNQNGVYEHYKMLANATPLPIILYNVPGRTGSNMSAETTLRLAHDFKNVIAIKEASANLEQMMKIVKDKPADFMLISGDDNLTLPILSFGGVGVISVTGQAIPKVFSDMVNAALAGDYKNASKLHIQQFELTEQLFADGNPGGVKAALKSIGLIEDYMRPPLYKANQSVYTAIDKIMAKYHSHAL